MKSVTYQDAHRNKGNAMQWPLSCHLGQIVDPSPERERSSKTNGLLLYPFFALTLLSHLAHLMSSFKKSPIFSLQIVPGQVQRERQVVLQGGVLSLPGGLPFVFVFVFVFVVYNTGRCALSARWAATEECRLWKLQTTAADFCQIKVLEADKIFQFT